MNIGSEYNIDFNDINQSANSFFDYIGDKNYCLFDSGRSALRAVVDKLSDSYILIPEYICESVIKCFPKDKIVFYKLRDNLQIDEEDLIDKINSNVSAVYINHYFGTVQNFDTLNAILKQKEKHGFKIIEDTTHSIFSNKQTIGDFCFASLRKWFAIPNGGVLYSNSDLINRFCFDKICRSKDNKKMYAMMLKTLYLNGQLYCNLKYREIFKECEKNLDEQKDIKRISDVAEFLLGCFDVGEMIEKRKQNYKYIKSELDCIGVKQVCEFSKEDCPYTIPILVPNRDDFRKYLSANNIYCAVHWPFDGFKSDERPLTSKLSDNIISLPIDQRYGEEEIEYLLKVIKDYKGRLMF